mmetsp:Transcript_24467/g.57535  ORF Transcript_24467/g.57535 Transcript_24467/m.57535 type:complete len:297 (+) Transcript_24467:2441-3331(+)
MPTNFIDELLGLRCGDFRPDGLFELFELFLQPMDLLLKRFQQKFLSETTSFRVFAISFTTFEFLFGCKLSSRSDGSFGIARNIIGRSFFRIGYGGCDGNRLWRRGDHTGRGCGITRYSRSNSRCRCYHWHGRNLHGSWCCRNRCWRRCRIWWVKTSGTVGVLVVGHVRHTGYIIVTIDKQLLEVELPDIESVIARGLGVIARSRSIRVRHLKHWHWYLAVSSAIRGACIYRMSGHGINTTLSNYVSIYSLLAFPPTSVLLAIVLDSFLSYRKVCWVARYNTKVKKVLFFRSARGVG